MNTPPTDTNITLRYIPVPLEALPPSGPDASWDIDLNGVELGHVDRWGTDYHIVMGTIDDYGTPIVKTWVRVKATVVAKIMESFAAFK